MNTLFTYGYSGGGSLADLQAYAAAGAMILDVRLAPNSRVPQWRGGALAGVLGHDYAWCAKLGNVNYKTGGPIRIAEPEAGIAVLRGYLEERAVVLLCACKDPFSCHRAEVADLAKDAIPGLAVVYLWPGDPLFKPRPTTISEADL